MSNAVQSSIVLPYSLPSAGPEADPSIQAVSPQVTFQVIPGVGSHYFPPGLRSPSQQDPINHSGSPYQITNVRRRPQPPHRARHWQCPTRCPPHALCLYGRVKQYQMDRKRLKTTSQSPPCSHPIGL